MGSNAAPRREPSAHIKSLEFDPERKMLIVEGVDDRLFLENLSNGQINKNTVIVEIDTVEISEPVQGGNRGRVIHFASLLENGEQRIKFFIDRDYSGFTGEEFSENVILTDFKDLEGYLYEEPFMEKFIKIGLKTDKLNSKQLLQEIDKATFFGFVRMTSQIKNYNLSINKTNERISKYLEIDNKLLEIEIKKDDYLKSVIQNSLDKIELKVLKSSIEEISLLYQDQHSRYVIHGKDAISIVQEVCQELKFKKENIDGMFWMSFDSNKVNQFQNLQAVLDFLKN